VVVRKNFKADDTILSRNLLLAPISSRFLKLPFTALETSPNYFEVMLVIVLLIVTSSEGRRVR
jgi:hypothetical protein